MSAPATRRVSLGAIVLAVAVIAACGDSATEPKASLKPHTSLKADGDSAACSHGWIIQSGRLVCLT